MDDRDGDRFRYLCENHEFAIESLDHAWEMRFGWSEPANKFAYFVFRDGKVVSTHCGRLEAMRALLDMLMESRVDQLGPRKYAGKEVRT